MGRYALSYDDYLSAIHYFNSVLDVRPKHAQAYYYRAYAKFSLGDFSGAENDCTASIRLNPYLTETYRLRGLCRIRKSEFQGAITDYEQVLKDFPSDEGALFNQGLCYLQVHKTDSATIAADRLLKQSPKFYRGYMLKAQIAFEQGEVPVGAVITIGERIIAKAHNLTEKLTDVTAHAEMQAITAASEYLGGKYLMDCTLYVTLEPCVMCAGALYWSQIGRLIYGATDSKRGYHLFGNLLHPKTQVVQGVLEEPCSQIVKDFFLQRRL